jgi:hypothetical protein
MNFLKNSLLLIVSLILVIILGEMAARFVFRDITSTANMQTWFGMRWKAEYVQYNDLGYRDKEFTAEKEAGVYRIAVIGDSFGFGQGLPVADRFGDIIEAKLNQSGVRAEVYNFSLPGQTTQNELDTLQESVLPLNPDFILVQWLPNDFERQSETWVPRRVRLVSDYKLHLKLRNSGVLYFLIDNLWFNLRPFFGYENFDYADNLLSPFQDPESEVATISFQPMVDFIAALNASGIDFAIALHPLIRNDLGDGYTMQPLHDLVSAECSRANASCLDLTPPFAAYGAEYDYSRLWVNRFDGHPGKEANQLVADYVLQHIGQESWEYAPD